MGIQLKKADGSSIYPMVKSSDISWDSKVNSANVNWDDGGLCLPNLDYISTLAEYPIGVFYDMEDLYFYLYINNGNSISPTTLTGTLITRNICILYAYFDESCFSGIAQANSFRFEIVPNPDYPTIPNTNLYISYPVLGIGNIGSRQQGQNQLFSTPTNYNFDYDELIMQYDINVAKPVEIKIMFLCSTFEEIL